MAVKLITEQVDDVEYVEQLDEATGKKHFYIQGPFLQGGIKNQNGRVYPVETLESEVNRYTQKHVQRGSSWGELGHPSGPQINLERVSHRIVELKHDGNGNFIGKAKLADTPYGKIARGLIESGGRLGVSSRGMGTLKEKNGVMEVQNDFRLATAADIVADPSAPDAWVNGIYEAAEWVMNPGGDSWKRVEPFREEMLRKTAIELREQKLKLFERFLRTL